MHITFIILFQKSLIGQNKTFIGYLSSFIGYSLAEDGVLAEFRPKQSKKLLISPKILLSKINHPALHY